MKRSISGMVWVVSALMAGVACGSWLAWPRPVPRAVLKQAGTFADTGNWTEARRLVDRWLAENKHDAEALMLLARIFAGQDDHESSLECLKRIASGSRVGPDARLREGQAAWQVRLANLAETSWRACIALDPHSWQAAAARLELLQLFEYEGRREESEAVLWELYRTHSSPWKLLSRMMQVKLEEVDPHTAQELLGACLERDPSDYYARRALGRIQGYLGQTADSRSKLEACVAERPTDFRAWEILFFILHQEGDLESLSQHLGRLPSSWERRAEVWKFRGLMMEDEGRDAEAADCFRRAVELETNVADYHYRLSRVLSRLGESSQGEQHWQRYNEIKDEQLSLNKLTHSMADSNPDTDKDPEPDVCHALGEGCRKLGWVDMANAWDREGVRLAHRAKTQTVPQVRRPRPVGVSDTLRSPGK